MKIALFLMACVLSLWCAMAWRRFNIAKALGVSIPERMPLRADKVIE
jgi:hypothetical protein